MGKVPGEGRDLTISQKIWRGEVRYLGRQRYGGVLGGLEEATCGPLPMLSLDLGLEEALLFSSPPPMPLVFHLCMHLLRAELNPGPCRLGKC